MSTEIRVRDVWQALRPAPPLAPDDSVAKAARLLRARAVPVLLVAEGQQLVGQVHEADLLAGVLVGRDMFAPLRSVRVARLMKPVPVMLSLDQRLEEAARRLAASGQEGAPVTDAAGRYLGILLRRDILAALAGEPPVPTIAGLATPFGVHLTTGALRAGAGNLALASTGAALMVMNFLAGGAVAVLQRYLPEADRAFQGSVGAGVAALALAALQILLFLLLLRFSSVSGVHAGEHMVVRAIEEGEDLTPEKVRPMPRAHPRCGTNLVALLVLVAGAQSVWEQMRQRDPTVGGLVLFALVLVVAFTWRRLGLGMQRWVTTRPPSERQLQGAIAVGEELLRRVARQPGASAGPMRRLWNMGFLQVVAGATCVEGVAHLGSLLVRPLVG